MYPWSSHIIESNGFIPESQTEHKSPSGPSPESRNEFLNRSPLKDEASLLQIAVSQMQEKERIKEELVSLRAANADFESARGRLDKDIQREAKSQGSHVDLEESDPSTEATYGSLDRECDALDQQVHALEAQIGALRDTKWDYGTWVLTSNVFLKQKIRDLEQEKMEHERLTATSKSEVNALAEHTQKWMQSMKDSRDELRARTQSLEKEMESLKSANAQLKREKEASERAAERMQTEVQRLTFHSTEWRHSMQARQDAMQRRVAKSDTERMSLERENVELKEQNAVYWMEGQLRGQRGTQHREWNQWAKRDEQTCWDRVIGRVVARNPSSKSVGIVKCVHAGHDDSGKRPTSKLGSNVGKTSSAWQQYIYGTLSGMPRQTYIAVSDCPEFFHQFNKFN